MEQGGIAGSTRLAEACPRGSFQNKSQTRKPWFCIHFAEFSRT